jgi:exosortase
MKKYILSSNVRGRLLVFFLILLGLGLTLYSSALLALFSAVLHREGSSHGLFIPFFCGYLLWLKSDKLKGLSPQVNLLSAAVFFLIGCILFGLSKYTAYSLVFAILSFLCIAASLILLLFGSAVFKETAFPLFFLAAMIPVPREIYAPIADWMRQISTWGSVRVTRALGVPLYQEGYNIFLPTKNLIVADSCSGIRYLLSYFTFSIVYAALFKQNLSGRLLVILGSIPLSIFAGIARLSTVFVAVHYISPIMGDHRPHVLISWAVFAVILFGVIAVDQYLSKEREE